MIVIVCSGVEAEDDGGKVNGPMTLTMSPIKQPQQCAFSSVLTYAPVTISVSTQSSRKMTRRHASSGAATMSI